jgi:hypothetical protein
MGRLRRLGLVRYQREGPLRVDVPALTVYLGLGGGGSTVRLDGLLHILVSCLSRNMTSPSLY